MAGIDKEIIAELAESMLRIAKALEHTHKCEEEISETLKDMHKTQKKLVKLHEDWFTDSRGTVIPKKP